jgi:uncharacterized protein YndB with AHSA1/START domain/uncharacterized membrane protein YphA (DoxX/SURF4 family)
MEDVKTQSKVEGRTITVTRDFSATAQLMFDMWSDCKHLKHWWGPKEWPMDECEMDFREGGEWRYCLRGPNEGDESWGKAIYREINKPDKIVYKDHFTDKHGQVNDELPEPLVTVEFKKIGHKTRQTMSMQLATPEECQKIADMGFVEGMTSSLDRMDDYLPQLKNSRRFGMKSIIQFIASLIMGLMFINAGLNKLFNYIPVPDDLPERLTVMNNTMAEIGWLLPLVAVAEITGGVLFITKRTRALGAIILFPVMIGILLIHLTAAPSGLPVAAVLLVILLLGMYENRSKYLELVKTDHPGHFGVT